MSDQHSTVKQTHNIVMTRSRSAGANIMHIPNYHLSRCTPLSEDDRNKSSSSQDDATWVLQQLASMIPLSDSVCKLMMGCQTYDNTTIMQCSEMFTGVTTSAAVADIFKHPTNLVNTPPIPSTGGVADPNTYDACAGNPVDRQMPWASYEYSTNEMQNFMTLFNPSTYVYDHSIQKNFVPDHINRQVMVAFADAIEANKTMTPDLERALTAVFQSGTSHIPCCPAKASTNVKVVPVGAHSEIDWINQLRTLLA